MADIFISYSHTDVTIASKVVSSLERSERSVFWDRNTPVGQTWDEVLEKELGQAGCVVVLWSITSIESKWVRAEALEAEEKGILVPARIHQVELPLRFKMLQAANLIGWDGDPKHTGIIGLVNAVEELLNSGPSIESRDADPLTPSDLLILRSIGRSTRQSKSFEGLVHDTAIGRSQVEFSLQRLGDIGLIEYQSIAYGGGRYFLTAKAARFLGG